MIRAGLLGNVPMFRGLSHEKLQPLAARMRLRYYRRGQVIFHQDDPGGQLYVIVAGQVRISIVSEDGRERDIALLGPGECLGEVSLLDGNNRSATATAAAATETLTLDRDAFYEFLRENPEATVQIAIVLSQRLRAADQLLGDILFLDVPTRVAKQLLLIATSQGVAQEGNVFIYIDQEQLSRLVGASRETVNRVLRSYQDQGILTTSHRRITITNLEALRDAASFT